MFFPPERFDFPTALAPTGMHAFGEKFFCTLCRAYQTLAEKQTGYLIRLFTVQTIYA